MGRRGPFTVVLVGALALALAFLILPVVAIFANTAPADLIDSLGSEASREALWLSLKTTLAALAVIVVVGTPAAYLLATREFRGKRGGRDAIELPLVLPPAVAGIGLLAAFGPKGIFGGGARRRRDRARPADRRRDRRADLRRGAVLPAPGAGGLRRRRPRPDSTPRGRSARARRAPSGGSRSPAPERGISTGMALAWGRALGEFGATLMFAGSFQGITQTVPLAIFASFATDFPAALALSAVLVAISAALLLGGQAARPGAVARRNAGLTMAAPLSASLASRLRELRARPRARGRRRTTAWRWSARRAPGRRTVLRVDRRPAPARSRPGRRSATTVWLDRRPGSTCRPSAATAATCSRTTRCSRT